METPRLWEFPYFAYDTETTGLQWPGDQAFSASITTSEASYYWDFRREPKAIDYLNDAFSRCRANGTIIACHYASFDARMSASAGITIPLELLDCTILRAALIDEQRHSYKLDDLAWDWLGKRKQEIDIEDIANVPYEVAADYAMFDTELTYDLYEYEERELERLDLRDIHRLERSVMPNVIRTEMAGVRVDLDAAERAIEALGPIIGEQQSRLNALTGRDFNVKSAPQVKELFGPYELVHEDRRRPENNMWARTGDGFLVGTTKSGNPSLGKPVLEKMDDERARLIIDIRTDRNTRDVFLTNHIIGHAVNGRVYPSINQCKTEFGSGVGPGRFSYTDPALQQIPSRNKAKGKIVKSCFLPDEGEVWLDYDLQSFEVRIFAHLVAQFDPRIIEIYKNDPNTDFHQYVSDLCRIPRSPRWSGDPNGKQLNLSMIFCQGNGSTAEAMGMPWEWNSFNKWDPQKGKEITITYKKAGYEAMDKINTYHDNLPGVSRLAEACQEFARANGGCIRTDFGRRIQLKGKIYKASGLQIQGTSADVNKKNWAVIDETLDGRGRMILNVHDSYGLSVPEELEPKIRVEVKEAIETAHNLNVPLILDHNGTGKSWWDAIS